MCFLGATPAWPQAAVGGSQKFDVTPANVDQHAYGFKVTTQANVLGLPHEDTLRFSIEVTERQQPLLPESHALFWVSSGGEFVASVDVAPVRHGKTLRYDFVVGRKHLGGETSFMFVGIRTFTTPAGTQGNVGDFYTFSLPQFAPK